MLFLLAWEFWIVLVAIVALVFASSRDDETHSIFSLIVLIAMFVALHYLGDFSIIAWIKENPGALWFLPLYFIFGAVWSICKWYLLLQDKLIEVKDAWEEWQKSKTTLYPSFAAYAKERKPKAIQHRDRIIYWINFWPVSIVWTLLHEIFEKIALRIYNSIREVYDKLGNKVFNFEEADNGDKVSKL